ncbi:DUF6191 domain-containing protein [Streptomyces sp. NPDC016845]|uniref:DUF6191 domain-containing protein n=1 Tax=Streptomyces sp. NPDC016845 TaxID=3364972 RepID=UPI0037B2D5D5
MFEDLFAPGRKHTNDERKRLELTRVDLNDGDPGRGPIDLSSGKVTVRVSGAPSTFGRAVDGASGAGVGRAGGAEVGGKADGVVGTGGGVGGTGRAGLRAAP